MEAGVWLLALAFRKRDEVLEKLSLEEMRQIELDIARDIDRVCRENDIEYVLGYGSCLGAIRHGGFIPWDDDMDIVMLRPDYERFLTVFNECRRDDRFKLVSYRDKSAPCAVAKSRSVIPRLAMVRAFGWMSFRLMKYPTARPISCFASALSTAPFGILR